MYCTHVMDSLQDNEFIITIPAIPCSFQWRNHPDELQLKEMSNAWLVDRCKRFPAACKSELTAKLFSADLNVNSTYYLLVTLSCANSASTQRLLPILKLVNWYFMIDTCVDEPSEFGADPANATLLVERVMALFDPNHGQTTSSGNTTFSSSHQQAADELAKILTDIADEWWSDMRVDMPLSQQERYREIFKGYLHSILEEIPFRSACQLPDVQTYLRIRSHTIGWYPIALLTEYTLYMDMDQEALTNPLLIDLKQSVCESIIIVNDVMSFGREYMRGDIFNIIMVLCFNKLLVQGHSLPALWPCLARRELLQECMFEVCEMIGRIDQKCVRLIEEIKRSPMLMQKPGMRSFLEAMANHVSGNIYWHLKTCRYSMCITNDKHTTELPPNLLACRNLRLSPIKL